MNSRSLLFSIKISIKEAVIEYVIMVVYFILFVSIPVIVLKIIGGKEKKHGRCKSNSKKSN